MPKTYRCANCRLTFESDAPQTLTHPADLKLVGITPEDAAKHPPVICPECLESAKQEAGDFGPRQEED